MYNAARNTSENSARSICLMGFKIKLSLCLVFACLLFFFTHSQNTVQKDKISPVFRSLIEENNISLRAPRRRCIFKKKQANKSVAEMNAIQKTYDCIVYTSNGNLLKEKGFIVNSILPTFVTASATLQQMLQMASLPEVTYIDAPSTHSNQN